MHICPSCWYNCFSSDYRLHAWNEGWWNQDCSAVSSSITYGTTISIDLSLLFLNGPLWTSPNHVFIFVSLGGPFGSTWWKTPFAFKWLLMKEFKGHRIVCIRACQLTSLVSKGNDWSQGRDNMTLEGIRYRDGNLEILDQLLLPHETKFIAVRNTQDGWNVIQKMQVGDLCTTCSTLCSAFILIRIYLMQGQISIS